MLLWLFYCALVHVFIVCVCECTCGCTALKRYKKQQHDLKTFVTFPLPVFSRPRNRMLGSPISRGRWTQADHCQTWPTCTSPLPCPPRWTLKMEGTPAWVEGAAQETCPLPWCTWALGTRKVQLPDSCHLVTLLYEVYRRYSRSRRPVYQKQPNRLNDDLVRLPTGLVSPSFN